jgi:hypothetical protein
MALNSILNRTLDTVRSGVGEATRLGSNAAKQGVGLGKRFTNRNPEPKEGMDDVTLTRKVETEIFRPANAPKGKVDVNAVEGVVWLRGEVKNQKQSAEIEAKVRAIPEVQGVENLLHLPKTPAPSRTRGGAKKTTTKKAAAAKSSTGSKRFAKTAEKTKSSDAEPLPSQAATTGAGRHTAPLGTTDPQAPSTTTSESVTGGTTPTPTTGNGGGVSSNES